MLQQCFNHHLLLCSSSSLSSKSRNISCLINAMLPVPRRKMILQAFSWRHTHFCAPFSSKAGWTAIGDVLIRLIRAIWSRTHPRAFNLLSSEASSLSRTRCSQPDHAQWVVEQLEAVHVTNPLRHFGCGYQYLWNRTPVNNCKHV